MHNYKLCLCTIFLTLFSSFLSTTAGIHRHFHPKFSTAIAVDPSGKAGFRTIQAAIDSVPPNNHEWTTIAIKPGVYRERVVIPREKPFIFLKGGGMKNTLIVWDAHGRTDQTSTFTSQADNTLAKDITFTNSYNSPPSTNRNPMDTAVAAFVQGDKSVFYRCGFFGLQDTLWDDHDRHYYKSCTIEGAVDFIFGNGQSIYEGCTISVAAGVLASPGFITAQGRNTPQDPSGFVFKNCNIIGSGKTYLGRPWRDYARVLYYNTSMSDIIVPLGWDPWFRVHHEDMLTLAEYNCSGPGAKSVGRVKWEKKLSEREVNEFINISFIDKEGWLKKAFDVLGS